MCKPQRAVMRMVMLLAGGVLHRPIAGHGHIPGTDERIAVWPGHVLVKVFGEELAVDLDAKPVSQLVDLVAFLPRRRRAHVGGADGINNAQEDEGESQSHNAMVRHNTLSVRRLVARVNPKWLTTLRNCAGWMA